MPRYFFDTDDGTDSVQDEVGLDLPDHEAARQAALGSLPDMARDVIPDGDHRDLVVRVRDDAGQAIYTVHLTLSGERQAARPS